MGSGGTGLPIVGQAPQIFWFQQQKYALLKSRLFCTVAKSTLVSITQTPADSKLSCPHCFKYSKNLSHHSSPIASLHWLKIKERIEYKLLSLTCKILSTSQATYLHNLVSPQSPRRLAAPVRHLSPHCPDQNHEMHELWSVDSQENY